MHIHFIEFAFLLAGILLGVGSMLVGLLLLNKF